MASITLTVKDSLLPEVLDAFDATIRRDPADTKAQHLKRVLQAYVKGVLMEYRRKTAVDTAIAGVVDPGPIE